MRVKRLLAGLLTVALLSSLSVVSAAAPSAFYDVTDPTLAEQVEFLRLLGVVNGVPGGGFDPDGTLTRAQFCKLAVTALDRADEEPSQRGRTIYLDVTSAHWARGYINLASAITLGEDTTPLVSGVGDGTFQPDRAITYGEAVTILCRVLGYGTGDAAAGGAWYEGYLSAGASAGLTDGLTLSGTDVITRAQAAALFYNLYFSKLKGSSQTYLTTMGGSVEDGGIILDVDATADDGSPAVRTTKDTYQTERTFDTSLEGQEGKAVLDADGRLIAFQPKAGTSQRVVNIISTQYTYLTASGGEKLTVEPDTLVYRNGKATTWGEIYLDLTSTVPVTFHYGANGKLAYLFFSSASTEGVTSMVARTLPNGTANPFASMASGSSYTMFKNGVSATAADLRQWDVATYDPATRVIQVSDLKLTGIYETASPSPKAPGTITVMGHEFPVLASARDDLSAFQIGDKITLLLTSDAQVAGAVSADVVKGDTVGLASVDGTTATVTLLQGGLTVSGTVSSSAGRYDSQLVTVSSSSAGKLSLAALSGSAAKGSLDVVKRTLGDREIAENVVVYDRVKDGAMVKVSYDSLTTPTLSKDKISFVGYDYAGRVKYLVLNDATGDAYEYGYFIFEEGEEGADYKYADTLGVRQADTSGSETVPHRGAYIGSIRSGGLGGVAFAANGSVAATVTLQTLKDVSRTAFDMDEMTVTVAGVTYPVSDKVQCYNKTTGKWLTPGKEGLTAARAYADTLTLYYDRTPDQGGKIRMVVVS